MPLREGSSAPDDPDLDDAITRTVAYAALFQYPMRLSELRRRLMDVPATTAAIAARLACTRLRGRIAFRAGFVVPAGSDGWIEQRRRRAERSRSLMARHAPALRRLARLPFVRMVALSGACAHDNATDDDVDVFLIVRRKRAWTVALAVMVASKLAGLRRSLCVNYVLADDGLALPEHDRFTATEIVGLRPLAGREAYRDFVQANGWLQALYPNFVESHRRESEAVPVRAGAHLVEAWLNAVGAGILERAARALLEPYLRARVRGAGVQLARHRLKLHAHDHRLAVNGALEVERSEAEARSA